MSRRQIIRRRAPVMAALAVAATVVVPPPGPTPAGADHAETVESSGLGGFVASATGYTTPGLDALAGLGREAAPCTIAGQTFPASFPPEVAGLVAGNVTP